MSFVQTLGQRELRILRSVVKRVHMAHFPSSHQTDYEADKIIDAIGPEVAERFIRAGVDSGEH